MRHRIDGISAHESSNGNRILCSKGLASFDVHCTGKLCWKINEHIRRLLFLTPPECHHRLKAERRINSHADEYIKAFYYQAVIERFARILKTFSLCEWMDRNWGSSSLHFRSATAHSKLLVSAFYKSKLIAFLMDSLTLSSLSLQLVVSLRRDLLRDKFFKNLFVSNATPERVQVQSFCPYSIYDLCCKALLASSLHAGWGEQIFSCFSLAFCFPKRSYNHFFTAPPEQEKQEDGGEWRSERCHLFKRSLKVYTFLRWRRRATKKRIERRDSRNIALVYHKNKRLRHH